eukprot:COSAG06_NODE_34_length_31045_cov_28.806469_24_plen_362_part_00
MLHPISGDSVMQEPESKLLPAPEPGPEPIPEPEPIPQPDPEPEPVAAGPEPEPAESEPVPQQGSVGADGLTTVAGRYATLSGIRPEDAADVSYTEGTAFDSVCLGPNTSAVQHNSVLLVPALLSDAECVQLIDDVERCYAADSKRNRAKLRHRMLIPQLSEASQQLFDTVLRSRVLPLVSKELPAVEDYIWARSKMFDACSTERTTATAQPLSSLPWRYSQYEPAINRYKTGGDFPVHVDGHALTLNVLLNRPGQVDSFSGGGTAFWCELPGGLPAQSRSRAVALRSGASPITAPRCPSQEPEAALALHPVDAGTAALFSGTVQHAGLPVSAGVRYLLVASFSIADGAHKPVEMAPPSWAQ